MFEFNRILKKSVLNRSKFKWFTYLYFPIAFVLILRNGINFWGYDKYALEWVKVWPKPVSVFSVENSGNLFLAKIFGVDSRFSWIALHISLTVVFFIFLGLERGKNVTGRPLKMRRKGLEGWAKKKKKKSIIVS
jgi:hypothetical protein